MAKQTEKKATGKTKATKKIYGTSHTISLDEARYVYEKGSLRAIRPHGWKALKSADSARSISLF